MKSFESYHAHLYYEVQDIDKAHALIKKINQNFNLPIGKVWDKPVGPHPIGSCQITVARDDFATFIPWLLKEHGDVDIFIHANTGDDLIDHTEYVMWIGKSYQLNLDLFN